MRLAPNTYAPIYYLLAMHRVSESCSETTSLNEFNFANNEREIGTINAGTQRLQADLWNAVTQVAGTQQTPVVALVVSGMNDVLNSQGYTQAAWWNRIPGAAWALMGLIAIFCNCCWDIANIAQTYFC
jgi:hypothetical protein